MKTTLLVLAAAALSGCAVYPSPAYETYESPVLVPYGVVQQPTYIYGSVYSSPGYRGYPRGYRQPHVAPQPVHPHVHAPHPSHGVRESIHNRLHRGPPLPHLPHHRR
jgi:hypothetical protein